MRFTRVLSHGKWPVEQQVTWKKVDVQVKDMRTGAAIFEQDDVEVPEQWSDHAASILSQKYFRKAGVPARAQYHQPHPHDQLMPKWLHPSLPADGCATGAETSARQVFHRLAGAWTYHGWLSGIFCKRDRDQTGGTVLGAILEVDENARIFYDELYLCLAHQIAAPNSPQWFNTGLWWAYGIEGNDSGMWVCDDGTPRRIDTSYVRPQPHACFLTSVEDDLVNPGGIMDAWVREARVFKHGSGSGMNVSGLRAKGERLAGGGKSSGVMSWLRIGDSAAGAIQSGGTTRRAAVMRIMDIDHPEVEEFINWKVREESKAAAMHVGSRMLRECGEDLPEHFVPQQVRDRLANGFDQEVFGIGWEEEANRTIDGQNSNNSVRVTDDFMRSLTLSGTGKSVWNLKARTNGAAVKAVYTDELWNKICRAAWASADPGLLFHDTINAWNTSAADGVIRTTNPCGEFHHLDGSACFAGETLVWTIDGPKRFDDLAAAGKPIAVLTELPDRQLAYREMIAPRKTKVNSDLVEITFKARGGRGRKNSFTKVRVTPDHKFYLSDGSMCEARNLLPGSSVESAYRSSGSIRTTSGDWVREYHLTAEFNIGHRPDSKVEHGHHVDKNHDNNSPANIEVLPIKEHIGNHSREWFQTATPEMLQRRSAKLSAALSGRKLTPDQIEKLRQSHLGIRPSAETIAKRSRSLRGIVRTDEWRRSLSGGVRAGHLRRAVKGLPSSTAGLRWITNGAANRKLKRGEDVPVGWVLGRNGRTKANHTVITVQAINTCADVYCGTVPSTGRFFISLGNNHREGVLVKNCNLASLRLTAFLRDDSSLDLGLFQHVCMLFTVVLDVSVSMASFPAEEFALGAWRYRTLGLGYADLGALLMRMALPYDSDRGRALAAALTSLMTGVAYKTSSAMAAELGSFPRWEANAKHMLRVLRNHARAVGLQKELIEGAEHDEYEGLSYLPARLDRSKISAGLDFALRQVWIDVTSAESFRNAQVTLLAPTGTISFVMGCDTTGVESDLGLIKYKNLAGGGSMKIVNQSVARSLAAQGFEPAAATEIVRYVEEHGTVEDCPAIPVEFRQRAYAVFECSNPAPGFTRCLRWEAHVEMLAAVQPHLSGAASKTINLPATATVEDVSAAYLMAWKLGVKAVALYRDGCKLSQPLQTAPIEQASRVMATSTPLRDKLLEAFQPSSRSATVLARETKEYLPWRRERGYTQKAKIGDQTLFWRVSEYPDGRPGEIFIELAHEGSTMRAIANSVAIAMSVALQHGTPIAELVDKFLYVKFEPAGYVEGHPHVKFATSIFDLIAKDLAITYLGRDDLKTEQPHAAIDNSEKVVGRALSVAATTSLTGDPCPACGGLLRRTGTCRTCTNCAWNEGCG